jgi:hypothetical protein
VSLTASEYAAVDVFRLACMGIALYLAVILARITIARERRRIAGEVPDRHYVAWQTSVGMILFLVLYTARRGSEIGRAPDIWTWLSSAAVLLSFWGVLLRIRLGRHVPRSARGRRWERSRR